MKTNRKLQYRTKSTFLGLWVPVNENTKLHEKCENSSNRPLRLYSCAFNTNIIFQYRKELCVIIPVGASMESFQLIQNMFLPSPDVGTVLASAVTSSSAYSTAIETNDTDK